MSERIAEDQTLEPRYFERMAASLNDKARLLEWLPRVTADYSPTVLDVGAGGGELANVLSQLGYTVTALDTNTDALDRIGEKFPDVKLLNSLANHVTDFGVTFDAIICSSILHEVYSYGDDVHREGHVSSLGRAFTAFNQVLNPGGRLLIRDGIRPDDWDDFGFIELLGDDENLEEVVYKYLEMCPFANGDAYGKNGHLIGLARTRDNQFAGTNRSLFEFALTYNWGVENYPREAKEIYGVFTLAAYQSYVSQFGFSCLHAEAYLLDGYVKGLADKVALYNSAGLPRQWFNTNAIMVYRKNER